MSDRDPIQPDDGRLDIEEPETEEQPGKPKIQSFGGPGGSHEDEWQRSPHATGHGAIHVKTFHASLQDNALEFMDRQINEWLDAHPEYEVKFATTTIGELKKKTGNEPALFVNVWV